MKTDEKIRAVCGNGPFEVQDVAEVQALAQLGARVLEILESTPKAWRSAIERADHGPNGIASRTICAARELGLLDTEGGGK